MKKNFVLATLITLTGCGGSMHKNHQLARNFFTQASLEVNNYQQKNDSNALRKALNDIDQSLTLHCTPRAQGLKATILYQLGKLEESKKIFEELLLDKTISKAKRADALNNYATVLYQLGQEEEAHRIWHELINNPHYVSPELAHFNLGYTCLNEAAKGHAQQKPDDAKQRLEESLVHFRHALAISREYVDALFFMGQAHLALNQYEQARDCYSTILAINPEHQTSLQMLKHSEKLANRPAEKIVKKN
jgi:tetratricopeptide (TPR) repeat protein